MVEFCEHNSLEYPLSTAGCPCPHPQTKQEIKWQLEFTVDAIAKAAQDHGKWTSFKNCSRRQQQPHKAHTDDAKSRSNSLTAPPLPTPQSRSPKTAVLKLSRKTQPPASCLSHSSKGESTLLPRLQAQKKQVPNPKITSNQYFQTEKQWETQPRCTCLLFQLFEKLISNSYSFRKYPNNFYNLGWKKKKPS